MTLETHSLMAVFSGWDGYQRSLVAAIAPLSQEQLGYRPDPDRRSVGEIAARLRRRTPPCKGMPGPSAPDGVLLKSCRQTLQVSPFCQFGKRGDYGVTAVSLRH
jgi:hypothetical protein